MTRPDSIRLPTHQLTLASVVGHRSGAPSAPVEDELVILDLRNGVYLSLDDIGRRIWDLLDGRRTISDVCDLLVGEFDVDAGRCRQDVLDLARQLAAADLVTVR